MNERQQEAKAWKFSEITADPRIHERWEKVRRYFFLRESTYDMTNRCNIRCEGCYYFKGEKQFAVENRDAEAWRRLMTAEKERGITFVVLAGAEPSLVPELCEVCQDVIPLGAIASNGIKTLPAHINYKIHISVWGNDASSLAIRKAKDMLATQMANYQNDPRVVFVYTFNPGNIEQCLEVTKELAEHGHKITFNMFSAPVGYDGPLRHNAASLARTGEVMGELLRAYPETVLYSPYSIVAHTYAKGLHDLYGCTYPRRNPTTNVGLGRSFRQYRTDLTWNREAACCVPDTDCADCRHYAAGSAVVTARLYRHAINPETFAAWLDYVDTYLAVWVMGYEKGENLSAGPVVPPEASVSA